MQSTRTDRASTRVADLVRALDAVTGGRLLTSVDDRNRWAISKSSGIPGKDVLELPGLVVGDPEAPLRRAAIAMTLTEHDIELAGALGIDALVVHHTLADGASSGGVPLATYAGLYRLNILECHEALHGLHAGIPFLHGHHAHHVDDAFMGNPGMVVMVGRPLEGVATLGDVLTRLRDLMGRGDDEAVVAADRDRYGVPALADSVTAPAPRILVGRPDDPIGGEVLHAFPHTGFRRRHLERALVEHPGVKTLVLSISRVLPDDDLVDAARAAGLGVVLGNPHPYEILENGLPLGHALAELLPGVAFTVFRERVVAVPLAAAGRGPLDDYGREMAARHLLPRARRHLAIDTDGERPLASRD